MSGNHRPSSLFLFFLLLIFLRPLVSGSGLDFFGTRAALDTFLRFGVLLIVLAAALAKDNKPLRIPVFFAVCLWLGWSLVASVATESKGGNFFVALGRVDVYIAVVAMAVASASLVRSDEEKELVIKALLCSGLVASLYGIWQYFIGFERTIDYVSAYGAGPIESARHATEVLGRRRVFSTTFSPDMFAGLMAVLIPLSVGYFVNATSLKRNKDRIFAVVVIVSELMALYFTGSLGGWLACGFGLLVLMAFMVGRSRRWMAGAVVVVVIVLIAAGGIVLRRAKTLTDLSHPHNPFVQRINYWRGGFEVAGRNPLTGVGPGHFGVAYLSVKPEQAGPTRYAHNAVVQYLSEIGIPGTIGFLWLAAGFLWYGLKSPRKDVLKAGIVAGGVAFLAHSMIDYDTEIIEVAGVFGVLLGLSMDSTKEAVSTNRGARKSFAVASLIALVMLIKLWGAAGAYFMDMADFNKSINKAEEAAGYIEAAKIFRGMDPELAELEGRIFTAKDDYGRALKAYEKQTRLFPRDPFAWMQLGKFLLERKEYEGALRAFRKANELYSSLQAASGMAHYCKAKIFIEEGNLEGAKAEFRAILDDFPAHKGALRGLEYIEKLEKSR